MWRGPLRFLCDPLAVIPGTENREIGQAQTLLMRAVWHAVNLLAISDGPALFYGPLLSNLGGGRAEAWTRCLLPTDASVSVCAYTYIQTQDRHKVFGARAGAPKAVAQAPGPREGPAS